MNNLRGSKFRVIFISSLILFSMLGTSAMMSFVPSAVQAKPADTADFMQFSSGGHALGFASDGMYAATGSHSLHVGFIGANNVRPQSDSAAKVNGKAATLSKVTYANLWNGITLTYTATPGDIYTTTYSLAPGAEAQNILLRYNAPLSLNKDGTLGIAFKTGRMIESTPIAWQEIQGSRVPVDVAFQINGKNVSFTLGSYNHHFALTIDPSLAWSTLMGATGADAETRGSSIAVDAGGNVYIGGYTYSSSWGNPVRDYSGSLDGFVAKLNSSGSLVWNTFLGGTGYDDINGIVIDGSGNIFVTGYSIGDWSCSPTPCTQRPFNPSGGSIYSDAFAAKLDSSGVLQWNTFLGGPRDDSGSAIALDGSGNIYVTGYSNASWGCTSASCTVQAYNSDADAFVVKLNPSGSLLWNTFLGGSGSEYGNAIAVDSAGSIYLAGYSYAPWSCSPVPCTVRASSSGPDEDGFVAKLNSAGVLQWNTFLGGSDMDAPRGIALDGSGNIYVSGISATGWNCQSPVSLVSCTVRGYTNSTDGFVAKLDSSGNMAWNTFLGGSGYEEIGSNLVVDGSGNVYLTGDTDASWGSPVDAFFTTDPTGRDIFAAKVYPSGALAWNTFFSTAGLTDYGYAIAVDGSGNIYMTGESPSTTPRSRAFAAKLTAHSSTISGNVGVAGVTLSYYDGAAKTAVSQSDGSYSFSISDSWNGTVTPSHACYTFSPTSLIYGNVASNQTAQDYTPTVNTGCANIDVSIAGNHQGTYGFPPQGGWRENYIGVNNGPLQVTETNAIPIIAAERDAWANNGMTTSFAQLMGLPSSQLSDTYYFPAYNNVTLDEQLRIGNVDSSSTTVTVTIGGVVRGTYPLDANQSVRVNYNGLDSGPVVVQTSPSVHIIAAIRDAWAPPNSTTTSFVQLMGLPSSQLSDTYFFPAYNNVTLNEQLRIGNVGGSSTTVTVTIGGVVRGTYPLDANQSVRVNYAGLDSGPVVVQASPSVHIIAAIRDAWTANGVITSFAQLMGLPAGGLSDTYLFPAYNNVTLDEQLRIGNVDSSSTVVTVTIGGVVRGTYPLAASQSVRVNYAGLDSGPVIVQASPSAHIIAAERDAWAANGITTSFVQMMGLPAGSLSDTYLFPAYNNVTLNEQLRFGVP